MNNLAYSGKAGRSAWPLPCHVPILTTTAADPAGAAGRGRFRDATGQFSPPELPLHPQVTSPTPGGFAAPWPGPAPAWHRLNPTCRSCGGTASPRMLGGAGALSCIPAPCQRVWPRYLLHQTKAPLLGTRASSPAPAGGAGKLTNKLQGGKAAAAGAARNHHCRKRHGDGS